LLHGGRRGTGHVAGRTGRHGRPGNRTQVRARARGSRGREGSSAWRRRGDRPGGCARRQTLLERADLRLDLPVPGSKAKRRPELEDGRPQVAEALEALAQEPAGQDVVGSGAQDGLELGARRGEVTRVEERAAEGHARRGVRGMHLQTCPRDADGVAELAVLPELLGELSEQPGTRLSFEALTELVDARVAGQDPSG
jgi:hypothetical protein